MIRLLNTVILIIALCWYSPLAQKHKPVVAANAPKPVGPYSPGLLAGNYLYVSGQGVRSISVVAVKQKTKKNFCWKLL